MKSECSFALGLDLGTNSIGWALIRHQNARPVDISHAGVRIFEAGMNLESGKATSRNLERREARGRRRNTERNARRMRKLRNLLAREGFLPLGKPGHADSKWKKVLTHNPYELRATALDEKLEPLEFGRAMYHLAQRRGFLSNRRTETDEKDEDLGKVKGGIRELDQLIRASRARTLGEFFAGVNPREHRIRQRYTARAWYEDEFEKLWEAQAVHHPALGDDAFRARVHDAIFRQRPLKSARGLIGKCELEKGKRRAPAGYRIAQRVRFLQQVNHTRIINREGQQERMLTNDERGKLIEALETDGALTFGKARKLLGLSARRFKFNHELGGEKRFLGASTDAQLRVVFGTRWDDMPQSEKDAVVDDWRSIQQDEALVRRARNHWELDASQAEAFVRIRIEEGYSNYSKKALKKLLPHLDQGLSIMEAMDKAYPDRDAGREAKDFLPPVRNIRNPIIMRSLTELRKLVNEIIRLHGKPDRIHIELARDLKQSSKNREQTWKRMRAREKERERAATKIAAEFGGSMMPRRGDIEKVLLADECGWRCPYTDTPFGMAQLLGPSPMIDIEHIIPFSRSLDNSFANKTLCQNEHNRNVKRSRTPFEAYAGDSEAYEAMLDRVRRFKSDLADEKLRRFMLPDVGDAGSFLDDFSSRQLNDTRYASRLAADDLGQLYGSESPKHIQTSAGRVTAYLRSGWDLNRILGSGTIKNRDDHRHHAVDAIVIALTTRGCIQQLSRAAANEWRPGVFRDIKPPWSTLTSDVEAITGNIVVSHRVDRRVNGPLHKETIYGLIRDPSGTEGGQRIVLRKPIDTLTEKEIREGLIVDPVVRTCVNAALSRGSGSPKKDFAEAANHPFLISGDEQQEIPIHRVRVYQSVNTTELSGSAPRYVATAENHHLAVYAATDRKGRPAWKTRVVSLLEAKTRMRHGDPAVAPVDESGNPLVFSLCKGDTVELGWKGERVLCVVQKFSDVPNPDYVFKRLHDARLEKDRRKDEIRIRSDRKFFESGCVKKDVTHTGLVRGAGG